MKSFNILVNRRHFLKSSGIAAAGAALPAWFLAREEAWG